MVGDFLQNQAFQFDLAKILRPHGFDVFREVFFDLFPHRMFTLIVAIPEYIAAFIAQYKHYVTLCFFPDVNIFPHCLVILVAFSRPIEIVIIRFQEYSFLLISLIDITKIMIDYHGMRFFHPKKVFFCL